MALCDATTGREMMILGSCQIAVLAAGRKLGPFMKRLTLEEIFEKSPSVQRAEEEQEFKRRGTGTYVPGQFFSHNI